MIFSAWHPDSRHVAYYDSRTSGRTAAIRTLDTKSGVTSPELAEVRHYPSHWNSCGLAFSPDGRYLVFPDSVGSSVQLVALRVSGEGMRARGRPKGFTRFPEYQTPLDPAFGGNGDVLGFGIDETVYEVDIAPLDLKQRIIGDATVPILTDKVINRECEWSKDGRRIVYVSRKGNQYDVYLWSRETRRTDRLTNTADNERLPTFVPDDEAIGFLKHGSVYRMPLSGGTAWRVFPPEGDSPPRKVYGYAWGLSTDVLYAVVAPRPGEPENLFPLIRVELGLGKEIRIRQFPVADEPNIEIQRSPDGGRIAYRFTDIRRSLYQTIGVVDLRTGKDRILTEKVGIVPNGEMAWTPDGNALIFRVNEQGGRFFKMDMASGNQAGMAVPKWFEKCMPGQISPTGDEILIYNLKQEKDVYALGGRSFTAK
jgi:Tol biopolymer transport system component